MSDARESNRESFRSEDGYRIQPPDRRPQPCDPSVHPPIPWRSRDEQPTSAFPSSDDPAGPLARGIRRRGADRPRGQPAEHQGRRYRRRRDDDPAAPGVDELAPDQLRRADELLSPAHPPAQPDAQRGDHGQPDGPRRRTSGRRGAAQRRPTVRCSGFRSSSRTTSTPPACRRQPAPGHSPGARPTTRSSRSG